MNVLHALLQLDPAQTVVAVAAMPWIAAALMQMFSAAARFTLDDRWNARAAAALRWTGTIANPAKPHSAPVVTIAPRRATRSISAKRNRDTGFYPHAA